MCFIFKTPHCSPAKPCFKFKTACRHSFHPLSKSFGTYDIHFDRFQKQSGLELSNFYLHTVYFHLLCRGIGAYLYWGRIIIVKYYYHIFRIIADCDL